MWPCPLKGLCKRFKNWLLTPWGHEWLPALWYPGAPRSIIPQGDFLRKFELFCENIITQDRMMKKTVCRKSRWNVPLNRIRKSHMTPRSMITRGDWLHAVCHTPGRFRKVWTTRRNLNQNRKYFNPLVSGPGKFEWWKSLNVENRGRRSL